MPGINKKKVISQLNRILESELEGVVRYTHYSLMVFGHSRIPIVSWFRDQANETLMHAQQAGELVTHFGGHPSLGIGPLLESHQHDIREMMKETINAEHETLQLYYGLLELAKPDSVMLEEYARTMIRAEEMHIDEIDKMLRQPGETGVSKEASTMGNT
jgi:bacterioferritin